jgi:methylenetetrahydrofolate reductase (NADPH)
MHLTCTNQSAEITENALKACREAGVRNIVALRGDPPHGKEGIFNNALDLVKFTRKNFGDYFSISVAGYPQGHLDNMDVIEGGLAALSPSEVRRACVIKDETGNDVVSVCRDDVFRKEMMYLKEKVDAGAEFVITQLFLDAQVYLDFVKECRVHGITVPIVPAIMCLDTLSSLKTMTEICKLRLPAGFRERAEKANTSDNAFKAFGIKEGVAMCEKLLEGGAPGLHFCAVRIDHVVAGTTRQPIAHWSGEQVVVGILKGLKLITEEQASAFQHDEAVAHLEAPVLLTMIFSAQY